MTGISAESRTAITDVLVSHYAVYVQGTAVHELAHVIDVWGRITVPGSSGRENTLWPSLLFSGGAYITDYAMTGGLTEYWAEAVADWVYGGRYKGPYDPKNIFRNPTSAAQADWIERFLKGWGW